MKKLQIFLLIFAALSALLAVLFFLDGFPIGIHNGRLVIYKYFCSDVCPQYGSWHKEYYGIRTREECEKIGGVPFIDPAWRGFVGCMP